MANSTKKYISLDKLNKYHGKIMELINDKDSVALQTAKDYADGLATNYDAAGSASTAQANVQANLDKEIARAKEAENANADAIEKAQKEVDELELVVEGKASQGEVDELKDYVGTIPEASGASSIVAYVQEKTAGIATEGSMTELSNRVTQVESDVNAVKSDYLKGADKTELVTDIEEALAAGQGAMAHSEEVASELAKEVTAREKADGEQVARIAALEGTVVGLSGAMHFKGVKNEVPTSANGYEQGDVIIVGNKEYVLNGSAFVEFGDATVNAEAITALTGRVDSVEDKVEVLEGKMDDVEGAVATKAEQSYVESAVSELEGADASLAQRLTAVEGKLGDGEGSVESKIATAKSEAISEAVEQAEAKDASLKTTMEKYADDKDALIITRVESLEGDTHTHSNKSLLDSYTQTEVDLADAVDKKHIHDNIAVLDGITSDKVTAWDKVGSKADQTALTTEINRAKAAEEANKALIESFVEASEDEINAIFSV